MPPKVPQPPLAIGDVVQVIAGVHSGVRVGTVLRVARVRPRRGKDQPELYELEGRQEYLFWRWELAAYESEL